MTERICIVTNSLSLGGAERISLLLAEWLHSKNVEVALITLNKDREKGYKLPKGINRIPINENSGNSKMRIISDLRKCLKEYKPSVVLVMGVPLCIYVIPALIGLKMPVIVSERNDPSHFAGKSSTKFISRKLMKYADGYVFQTQGAQEYYSKSIQEKSTIIPNPLMIENMPRPYIGEKKKKIVTVGRLVPQKNHELLIRAFKEIKDTYSDYTLSIYGNGKDYHKLKDLIMELGMESSVILEGTRENIFDEIIDSEMFVLSSDFEGMPNALIEAMALGLPVISTACPSGGPAALINHMKNGLLTPIRDKEKLTEAIKLLIEDENLSNSLAKNAVKIRKELNQERICKMWLNYFRDISRII
ncbi:glycosyltransferase family 4 protein [Priestia megaterium]|uniref:glycosyltransferase family 4 protein n=1 Tax=Priestia megaterium TaxID=1404 RepID=UPI001F1491DD|nr:glycosyltransferase family 4 protein [Priestia megaterium]UMZ34202.1 glycosyltransferase family 4 protein [Priestia megaterium]